MSSVRPYTHIYIKHSSKLQQGAVFRLQVRYASAVPCKVCKFMIPVAQICLFPKLGGCTEYTSFLYCIILFLQLNFDMALFLQWFKPSNDGYICTVADWLVILECSRKEL